MALRLSWDFDKNYGLKRNLIPGKFSGQKIFGPKSLGSKKKLGKEKKFSPKNVWSQKNCGSKKLMFKKCKSKKILSLKRFWVQNILSTKAKKCKWKNGIPLKFCQKRVSKSWQSESDSRKIFGTKNFSAKKSRVQEKIG